MKIDIKDSLLVEHDGVRVELETDTEGNTTGTFQIVTNNQSITGIPVAQLASIQVALATANDCMHKMGMIE